MASDWCNGYTRLPDSSTGLSLVPVFFVSHSLKFLAGHKMLNITENKTNNAVNPPMFPPKSLGAKAAKLFDKETKQTIYILLFLPS